MKSSLVAKFVKPYDTIASRESAVVAAGGRSRLRELKTEGSTD